MPDALRLVVYDATQQRRAPRSLGLAWRYGTQLYRALERVDLSYGARSFADALGWLGKVAPGRSIGELQFWGHGKWGRIFIDADVLDRSVLQATHAQHAAFRKFRERLAPDSLLWFRTCETLGAHAGQDFAMAFAEATGARVAGHTYVIGFFQSGLHCVRPGEKPSWSPSEGLSQGSAERPEQALSSSPSAPNTITCLTGRVPDGF